MTRSFLIKSIALGCLLAAPLLTEAQTSPSGLSPPSGATGADSNAPPAPRRDAKKAPAPSNPKGGSSDKNSGSDKNKATTPAPKQPDPKTAP